MFKPKTLPRNRKSATGAGIHRRRVLLDCRVVSELSDGVGRYTTQLVRAMADYAEDFEFQVLEIELPDAHELHAIARDARFKEIVMPPRRRGVPNQLRLPRIFREVAPDLFHHPNFTLPVFSPARRVINIYDAVQQVLPEQKIPRAIRRGYFQAATWSATRRADRIIALSNAVAQGLIDNFGVDPAQIVVVYPGVANEFLARVPREHRASSRPYILYVGTSWPHKNLSRLYRAFAGVASHLPHDLVIAGAEVGNVGELNTLARELGVASRIQRIGYVPESELPALYRDADAFLLVSLFEGFGLGVLEALASGTPVICSRGVSASELVSDTVQVVDANSVDEIARAIRRACTEPASWSRMREAGRELARRYTWATVAAQTIRVYESVLST